MTKRKPKKAAIDIVGELDDDALTRPIEDVDAELSAWGADPVELAAWGSQAVARQRRRARLRWIEVADAKLERARSIAARRSVPDLSDDRDALLSRLRSLRADPDLAGAASVLFRKRSAQESDIDELKALIDELLLLKDLKRVKGDD